MVDTCVHGRRETCFIYWWCSQLLRFRDRGRWTKYQYGVKAKWYWTRNTEVLGGKPVPLLPLSTKNLSHCYPYPPKTCPIATPIHQKPVPLWPLSTKNLSHCYPYPPKTCPIVTLIHQKPVPLLPLYTKNLSHCYPYTPKTCPIVTLIHQKPVPLLPLSTKNLSHCYSYPPKIPLELAFDRTWARTERDRWGTTGLKTYLLL
jgi:hypothetical protein